MINLITLVIAIVGIALKGSIVLDAAEGQKQLEKSTGFGIL